MTTATPTHEPRTAEVNPALGVQDFLTAGTLVGIALLFLLTLLIAHYAGATWGGAAAIGGWGALVGGPFFGVMVFFGGRVGALGE
ncbi:MAG TPA: hypothetical protein VHA57_08990 [Actinomycetota bacterium]|nr:hypothetical protein [Actinomycetota bacterium]